MPAEGSHAWREVRDDTIAGEHQHAPGMIDLGEKSAAAFMKRMAKQTPMRRNGSGEDVAAAVLFFATAPHFITGQIMAVDGGLGL